MNLDGYFRYSLNTVTIQVLNFALFYYILNATLLQEISYSIILLQPSF